MRIAIVLLLALVGLAATAVLTRRRRHRLAAGLLLATAALSAGAWWSISPSKDPTAPALRGRSLASRHAPFLAKKLEPEFGYVGSDACRECHPDQHASWHKTYHRTMTQPATFETIAARIETGPLTIDDRTYYFERSGNTYWVDMVDPDWDRERILAGDGRQPLPSNAPRVRKPIVMTTGSHNKQSYWVPSSVGPFLDWFPLTWRIDEQRWLSLNQEFLAPPDASPQFGVWDGNCIQCHSVGGQPRHTATALFDTHVAELGISCEACHGPASKHVASARIAMSAAPRSSKFDLAIVNPRELPHDRSSHACGQCHSFSSAKDFETFKIQGHTYRPGEDLHDSRVVIQADYDRNDPGMAEITGGDPNFARQRFWADGTCRVTGREYTAQMLSPCYQKGELSCLSCHSMHSYQDRVDLLGQGMETNQACLQCHPKYAENLSAHTHHAEGSSGSLCYNCHMPHTTYGLFKLIRTHRVDSPSVANSVNTGRPNACNLCHLDQTHEWTATRLTEWYAQPAVELSDEDKSTSASVAMFLRGDAAQRATIAWHFGWQPAQEASGADWLAPLLAVHLDDPYHAIRNVARKSLQRLPGFETFEYDYIGPEPDRKAAVTRALDLWTKQGHAPPANASHVLFSASGQLDQPAVEKLRAQRDDTPIFIAE